MSGCRIECVMLVHGECANVNTFDAVFRSQPPPRWSDRKKHAQPRYSFNALCPVPEEVLRRGYKTAGHLWCKRFWGSSDDLKLKNMVRAVGLRSYRFTVPGKAPVEALRCASWNYPTVVIQLQYIDTEPSYLLSNEANSVVVRHEMCGGQDMTSQSPNRANIRRIPDGGLHGLLL